MKLEVIFSDEQWKIVNEALIEIKYKGMLRRFETVSNNEDRAFIIVKLCQEFLKNYRRMEIWKEFFSEISKGD